MWQHPRPKPHDFDPEDDGAWGGAPGPHAPGTDWLYLMPMEPGATALVLGSEGGDLILALSRLCARVLVVEPDPRQAQATRDLAARNGAANVRVVCAEPEALGFRTGAFSVVVCQHPERMLGRLGVRHAAERLRALLAPNGCAALAAGAGVRARGDSAWPECTRPLAAVRSRFRLPALTAALLECGFREVAVLAALPGTQTPACVFPAADPLARRVAARHFVASVPRGGGLSAAIARVTAPAGSVWARVLRPGYWVVARSPASFRAPLVEEVVRSIAAQRPLPDAQRTDPSERVRLALRNRPLTFSVLRGEPGHRGHAVCLVFPQGWRTPACVLYIGRTPAAGAALLQSATAIQQARSRATPEVRDALPAPIGAATVRGLSAMATTHVEGLTLEERVLRARRSHLPHLLGAVLPAAADWLADLNVQTASRGWIQGAECEAALHRLLAEAVPGGLTAPYVAAVRAIAVAGTRLGAVHHRLAPRTLLCRPPGVTATHWTDLTLDDLPLADLYALVMSLGGLLWQRVSGSRGLTDGADAEAVFQFTFGGQTWYSRLVRSAVRRYCERARLPVETTRHYLPLVFLGQAWRAGQDGLPGAEAAACRRLASLALEWEP